MPEYWELTIKLQGEGDPPPEAIVKEISECAYEDLAAFGAQIKVETITASDEPCETCQRRLAVDPWIRGRALGTSDDE